MEKLLDTRSFEDQILKAAEEKIIVSFLDGLILCQLRNEQLSGYDLILLLHKKFQLLVSPGTLYSTLYSMERKNLVECASSTARKRTYKITRNGAAVLYLLGHSQRMRKFIELLEKEFSIEKAPSDLMASTELKTIRN